MNEGQPVSVVVGLISGKTADLRRCLEALHAQVPAPPAEILVPYEDAVADVLTLATTFPAVRFIHADGLDTARARQGFSREHHDTLRTIGLRAARFDTVILTEDHAHASPTWCRDLAAALQRHPNAAAIGGPVQCDSPHGLNHAVWFCDFGRYQKPLPDAVAEYVSDSNVAYRRQALQTVAPAWADAYHETSVHWAMTQAGLELRTTPSAVVWQARGDLGLGGALLERFVWARSFAGTRARLIGAKRWVLAVATPLLPAILTWRLFQLSRQRGENFGRFLSVLPLVALLQSAWALGELVGYVTADPG